MRKITRKKPSKRLSSNRSRKNRPRKTKRRKTTTQHSRKKTRNPKKIKTKPKYSKYSGFYKGGGTATGNEVPRSKASHRLSELLLKPTHIVYNKIEECLFQFNGIINEWKENKITNVLDIEKVLNITKFVTEINKFSIDITREGLHTFQQNIKVHNETVKNSISNARVSYHEEIDVLRTNNVITEAKKAEKKRTVTEKFNKISNLFDNYIGDLRTLLANFLKSFKAAAAVAVAVAVAAASA
mgnify:CR=1 FL=1